MTQQGDMVLYLNNDNRTLPAMILKVWTPTCCNLLIFDDATKLAPGLQTYMWHETSVNKGEEIGQWKDRVSECYLMREKDKE